MHNEGQYVTSACTLYNTDVTNTQGLGMRIIVMYLCMFIGELQRAEILLQRAAQRTAIFEPHFQQ